MVLIHEGGLPTGDYNECPGISGPIVDIVKKFDKAVDVVVPGHPHRAYVCEIDGRLVTSGDKYGTLVTAIDLKLDPVTRDVIIADPAKPVRTRAETCCQGSEMMAKKVKDAIDTYYAGRAFSVGCTETAVPSRTPSLKPLTAPPRSEPMFLSFLVPKMTSTMTRMMAATAIGRCWNRIGPIHGRSARPGTGQAGSIAAPQTTVTLRVRRIGYQQRSVLVPSVSSYNICSESQPGG